MVADITTCLRLASEAFEKDYLPPRGRAIARADLAHFLLDAVTNDDVHRAILGVSA